MPQTDSSSRKINSATYKVYNMPPLEALKTLRRLLSCVGGNDFSDMSKIMAALDEQTIDYLCRTFAKYTEVDGVRLDAVLDAHFLGKLGDMFRWLSFFVRFQYADFFSALQDELKQSSKQ